MLSQITAVKDAVAEGGPDAVVAALVQCGLATGRDDPAASAALALAPMNTDVWQPEDSSSAESVEAARKKFARAYIKLVAAPATELRDDDLHVLACTLQRRICIVAAGTFMHVWYGHDEGAVRCGTRTPHTDPMTAVTLLRTGDHYAWLEPKSPAERAAAAQARRNPTLDTQPLANVAKLAQLLAASAPKCQLHLPHCGHTIVDMACLLNTRLSKSLLMRITRAERQLLEAFPQLIVDRRAALERAAPAVADSDVLFGADTAAPVAGTGPPGTTADGDAARSADAPARDAPPPTLGLDALLVLYTLFPTIMLQQPERGAQFYGTLRHRLTLWENGDWVALFVTANVMRNDETWRLDGNGSARASNASASLKDLRRLAHNNARKQAEAGQLSKAMAALSPTERADPATVSTKLIDKHPVPAVPVLPLSSKSDDPISADERANIEERCTLAALVSAIRRAKRYSSPGPDGWRYEHFKIWVTGHPAIKRDSDVALEGFHAIVLAAICGDLPAWYQNSFATALLSALKKPNGDIRPIAVGNTLRRLTGVIVTSVFRTEITAAMPPTQVAVGTQAGCEGLALAVDQAILNDGWHVMKRDASNAFNSVDRHQILEEVELSLPTLRHFARYCYQGIVELSAPSSMTADGHITVWSREGTAQGDPCGMWLFALGAKHEELAYAHYLQHVADKLRLPAPTRRAYRGMRLFNKNHVVGYYADDGVTAGPPILIHAAAQAWPLISKHYSGLTVNMDKTEVFPPLPPLSDDDRARLAPFVSENAVLTIAASSGARPTRAVRDHQARSVAHATAPLPVVTPAVVDQSAPLACPKQIPATEGLEVAGIPIGAPEWRRERVKRKFNDVAERDLPLVTAFAEAHPDNLQIGLQLLVQCVFAEVIYLLRTSNPDHARPAAAEFDKAFRLALAQLCSLDERDIVPEPSIASRRAALPVKLGGMQWRRARDLALPAFVGGALAAAKVAARLTSTARRGVHVSKLEEIPFAMELGISDAVAALVDHLNDGHCAPPDDCTSWEAYVDAAITKELQRESPKDKSFQHVVTKQLELNDCAVLKRDLDRPGANHLDAMGMQGCRNWVHCLPTDDNFRMTAPQVRDSVRLRLGLAVVPAHLVGTRCIRAGAAGVRCPNGSLDARGKHTLHGCKLNDRTHNHDGVANILLGIARSVGCIAAAAAVGDEWDTVNNCAANTKPDVVVLFGDTTRKVNVDIALRSTFYDDIKGEIAKAEKTKIKEHAPGAAAMGRDFSPFVMHNLGGWGGKATEFMGRLKAAAVTTSTDSLVAQRFTHYWATSLSVACHRMASEVLTRGLHSSEPSSIGLAGYNEQASGFQRHMIAHAASAAAGRTGFRRWHGPAALGPRMDVRGARGV
jgi:hypothetical protein